MTRRNEEHGRVVEGEPQVSSLVRALYLGALRTVQTYPGPALTDGARRHLRGHGVVEGGEVAPFPNVFVRDVLRKAATNGFALGPSQPRTAPRGVSEVHCARTVCTIGPDPVPR